MAFGGGPGAGPGGPGGGHGPGGPGGFGSGGHGPGFHGGFGGPGMGMHGGFHGMHGMHGIHGFHGGRGFYGHGGFFGLFHRGSGHGSDNSDSLNFNGVEDVAEENFSDRIMNGLFARKPILSSQQQINYLPSQYAEVTASTLALLTLLQGCAIFASNIAATKVWHLGPLIVDGGLLLFPLTYVIGDVIVEIFHHRVANRVLNWISVINLIGCVVLLTLRFLPDAPGIDNAAINTVFAGSASIFIGSVVAFLVSGHINNWIYDRMHRHTASKSVGSRAWVSSFFARLADTTIFTIIGFGSRSSLLSLAQQAASSFLVGMIVETCMLPLTILFVRSIKRTLDE